jgi:hypothetical protein
VKTIAVNGCVPRGVRPGHGQRGKEDEKEEEKVGKRETKKDEKRKRKK